MYKEHPVFNPPADDAVLWRYMDFTKFVSLLEKSALFFVRADKLGDPFEGSFSKLNEKLRPLLYSDIPEDSVLGLVNFMRTSRQFMLINCWHEKSYESEAMWRLYSRETDGIAIKTDFKSLKKSFTSSANIYIGKVSYVDYESYFIPESNTFYPFLHKRQSFDHEREVRAIVSTHHSKSDTTDISRNIYNIGNYYEVDLSLLVQDVVVAPYAAGWFLELIQSVAARYNLEAPVVKSTLADNPTWG